MVGSITKSQAAMTLVVCAAVAFVVGSAFAIAAFAVLTPTNIGTYTGLGHASDWFHFVAALAALVGVSVAGWELVLRKEVSDVWEVGAAAVATLFIAIGALVGAASSSALSTANILGAIGIGGWALLALVKAARQSLVEQGQASGLPSQARLWLGASIGLVLLAIGSGFTVDLNKGLGIAAGIIETLGVGSLAATIAAARNQHFLDTRTVPRVISGLALVAVSFAGSAIVAGIVYGPSGTITELRIGGSLTTTVQLLGVALLGLAAWTRVSELIVAPRMVAGAGATLASSTSLGPPTSVSTTLACKSCGEPLFEGSSVCRQCGMALGPDQIA
jgi:hypothetical protein